MSKPISAPPAAVLSAPGRVEALAIRGDYMLAMEGARHFVRLGLRLLDVRGRLAHGEFLPWLEAHAGDLSRRHLYNSMTIARGAAEAAGLKFAAALQICTDRDTTLGAPIWDLVDGKSQRHLLSELREPREDDAERKAQTACELLWSRDAVMRDEWEIRVVGGELSYCDALRAMVGQAATKGQKRAEPNYQRLLPGIFTTACNGFQRWSTFDDETKARAAVGLRDMVAALPPELRKVLADTLSK